jgi:ferrous iron transport protein B
MFLRKAGTNILAISVVLWWLSSFPHVAPPQTAKELEARAAFLESTHDNEPCKEAQELRARAEEVTRANARRESIIGRLGRTVQPVFQPLGYDWQLTVGVLSSFAAREVFVSTMAVVVTGHEKADDDGVMDRLAHARRDDDQPLFSTAASWSLLVFFALAMQCMSTLVTTARESGSWKWAMLQLGWNTGWAYLLAMIVYMLLK